MKKIQDIGMMMVCALMLASLFLVFAFLAIFSSTIRWMIDQAMHKLAEVMTQGEDRFIEKHRQKPDA